MRLDVIFKFNLHRQLKKYANTCGFKITFILYK